MTRVPRSMQLYQRAVELIPGATQLISRRPSRFAYGVSPVYARHAQGARFTDVDGHEYIDWVSGIGSIILGYADPVVDEAVQKQLTGGVVYSINHELELELAEYLVQQIPCAEMVRYAKGGGEACAIAIRIARGSTGRDKVLFCGYHGWHDWYLAANLSNDESLDSHLFPGIDPTGVPQALEGTALPFPYGRTRCKTFCSSIVAKLLPSSWNHCAAKSLLPVTWQEFEHWQPNTRWSSFSTKFRRDSDRPRVEFSRCMGSNRIWPCLPSPFPMATRWERWWENGA